MIRITLAALAALMTTEVQAMEVTRLADADLEALRWNARPVVVLAEPGDPRLARQLALFNRDGAAMDERQMIVLTGRRSDAGALPGDPPTGDFAVLLIGKDGGVKARHAVVVDPSALIDLVDTMPMRRSEASD